MESRIVLVTGGSRGIGRAIGLRFAQERAKLFINYFQDREGAEKTAQEAASKGAEVFLFQADLKDAEQIRAMFKEVQRLFGRLDVLINAGWGPYHLALQPRVKPRYSAVWSDRGI